MTLMASRHFGVPERAILDALRGAPAAESWPIQRLRDGVLRELLEALVEFGPMRVFVRSRAAILEVVGTFGGLSETGPFLNVQTDTIDMHILADQVAALYAVEKIGHDTDIVTHSFQAFDAFGDAAFKAFLWEGFPDVPPPRVAAFRALAARLDSGSSSTP